MPNYDSVIDKLVEKSEAGALPWKPTFNENTFLVALEGEVTFEVTRLEDGGFEFTMKDKDGKKIIDINCHNVPHYAEAYVEDDRYYDKIKRLFEVARVIGLEVDKKLNIAESLLDKL
ncbi:MAG: hypothetical protein ABSG23_08455 [Terriglobales bacterium]|jgi:hypothetical protein